MITTNWIDNNQNFKEWLETIEITAKLLDYKVDFETWKFISIYDHEADEHITKDGEHWAIDFDSTRDNLSELMISFVNGLPIRIKFSASGGINSYSKDINDLPKFQKLVEDWL